MKVYDYKCNVCGHKEERFVHDKQKDYQICNQEGCNGNMQRLVSFPGMIKSNHADKVRVK